MHIILCLDERNGILFNKRRLSSDKAVCSRIIENATGRLLMNTYSAKLFLPEDICLDDHYLDNVQCDDTCFVEDLDFMDHLDKIATITVYRWNRHYPSDTKVPQDFFANWTLAETADFPGNSHDVITEERYVR